MIVINKLIILLMMMMIEWHPLYRYVNKYEVRQHRLLFVHLEQTGATGTLYKINKVNNKNNWQNDVKFKAAIKQCKQL